MKITVTPKRLWIISACFWLSAVGIAIMSGVFFSNVEQAVASTTPPSPSSTPLSIQHSFRQPVSLEEAIASAPFRLGTIERNIRLPDLRSLLVYYGSNDRPDRSRSHRRLQFGVKGAPAVHSTLAGEKVFFKYDTRTNKWQMSDSPSPLTVSFHPKDPAVEVTVEFQDEKGVTITIPSEFHSFSLSPSPAPAAASQSHQWLCGALPVDASLLDRQGAVWWGEDLVVQAFGGHEMAHEARRQRVQFGSGDNAYVLWVTEGDCFVHDDDRWKAAEPGSDTVGKPLMQAKSIDGRAIHFQLWNAEGTVRQSLDLIHREAKGEIQVPEIKVIGARSKKQWIAEIHGKKLTLTPDDWVLLKQDGFVQLDNEQLLEDYLQGRLSGNLLAFAGIEKVSGELCLVGTFYDSTRTLQAPFAISLYRSWGKKDQSNERSSSDDDDDDLDDDDEEFDFDDDEDGEELEEV